MAELREQLEAILREQGVRRAQRRSAHRAKALLRKRFAKDPDAIREPDRRRVRASVHAQRPRVDESVPKQPR